MTEAVTRRRQTSAAVIGPDVESIGEPGRPTWNTGAMGTEADTIAATEQPVTRARLAADLAELGVAAGDRVEVHASISSLGWVPGGAQTVLLALLDAVGSAGTLVFPTQTGQLSDPAGWGDPPVPEPWIPVLRAELPAFDPALTPSRGMGVLPEVARSHPGAVRSAHPLLSFVAIGPDAASLMAPHALAPAFGETSPLGRLTAAGASVLLLGVDHGACTALHLAEHRSTWPSKREVEVSAPILDRGGRREWVTWTDLELDEDDFTSLGAAWIADGGGRTGRVGAAEARLEPMPELVEFAEAWMTTNRT